jgi:hypothetical protein
MSMDSIKQDDDGNKVTYRKAGDQNNITEEADMNSRIVTKDQLESFREIIKNNVLENIVNGL